MKFSSSKMIYLAFHMTSNLDKYVILFYKINLKDGLIKQPSIL